MVSSVGSVGGSVGGWSMVFVGSSLLGQGVCWVKFCWVVATDVLVLLCSGLNSNKILHWGNKSLLV